MKKFLLKLLTLVCFGVLVGGTLAEPMTGGLRPQVVQAADTAPTPERSPSKDGWAWGIGLYFISNGITSQPVDMNVVQGTDIKVPMISTHWPRVFGFGSNEIMSVKARVYRGNGPWADSTATATLNKRPPYADITFNLGTLPVGTYYYQFTVNYSSNTPAYSKMIKITVSPAPKDADTITPVPKRKLLFWGESTDIDANLLPEDSTSPVTWTPPSSVVGTLSTTTGLMTRFTSAAKDIESLMRNPSGYAVPITATATNSVNPGTISGFTQVTLGGLLPQAATVGRLFTYRPAILNEVVFPEGSSRVYRWSVYNSDYEKITTTATLNQETFSWPSVTQPSKDDHFYLQLDIDIKVGTSTVTWRSNYAPLTVTKPASRLIAVPNLSFMNYVNGAFRAPTIGDFYQANGVTLRYSPLATQVGKGTYDGNNTGFLAVQTVGQNWNLSVQASGFTHQLSGLSLPTNPTLTLAVPLANGGSQVVSVPTGDAAAPVTVLANQTTNYSGNLNSATTLQVPQTSFMLTGNYQSNLTWTLTQAP